MATNNTNHRVKKHHAALRAAGLHPIQIWVPDTRQPGFAEEARRQCAVVAAEDVGNPELQDFMESDLLDLGDDECGA
ncbi:antitoxin MazE family protein [Halomonas sp.]|uniref:antitoxin MazE family protein n=1 Tax=Halomonas sp. TaxID=1486246 RepID=UPI00298E5844|nr:antitoxin MazE family protein [Halomonas sp.]MDW7748947.1 antitoxin MazE family protein [Halomonas sp.]